MSSTQSSNFVLIHTLDKVEILSRTYNFISGLELSSYGKNAFLLNSQLVQISGQELAHEIPQIDHNWPQFDKNIWPKKSPRASTSLLLLKIKLAPEENTL